MDWLRKLGNRQDNLHIHIYHKGRPSSGLNHVIFKQATDGTSPDQAKMVSEVLIFSGDDPDNTSKRKLTIALMPPYENNTSNIRLMQELPRVSVSVSTVDPDHLPISAVLKIARAMDTHKDRAREIFREENISGNHQSFSSAKNRTGERLSMEFAPVAVEVYQDDPALTEVVKRLHDNGYLTDSSFNAVNGIINALKENGGINKKDKRMVEADIRNALSGEIRQEASERY